MRFSLLHMLTIVWIAGGLIALDVVQYGGFDERQASYILVIVVVGAVFGQYAHNRGLRSPGIPKTWPSVAGIFVLSVFLSVAGMPFGSQVNQICTRSQQIRTLYGFGPVRISSTRDTGESIVVRDVLKYAPNEHHWATTTTYQWMGIGSYHPGFRFPQIKFSAADFRALSFLSPEELKDLVELDNPLDQRFAIFRDRIVFGSYLSERNSSVSVLSPEWYAQYEPFLHPFRSPEDVQNALRAYRKNPKWDLSIDHEFCSEMNNARIAIPLDMPPPTIQKN